jgi:hypothetical protein
MQHVYSLRRSAGVSDVLIRSAGERDGYQADVPAASAPGTAVLAGPRKHRQRSVAPGPFGNKDLSIRTGQGASRQVLTSRIIFVIVNQK